MAACRNRVGRHPLGYCKIALFCRERHFRRDAFFLEAAITHAARHAITFEPERAADMGRLEDESCPTEELALYARVPHPMGGFFQQNARCAGTHLEGGAPRAVHRRLSLREALSERERGNSDVAISASLSILTISIVGLTYGIRTEGKYMNRLCLSLLVCLVLLIARSARADGSPALIDTLISDSTQNWMGDNIEPVGDQNGDGYDDYLVSEMPNRVYLFLGGNPPDTNYYLRFDSMFRGL